MLRLGSLEVSYSSRGNATYRIEVWHQGLKRHRLIKGPDQSVVLRKAQFQAEEWNAKWADLQARESDRSCRTNARQEIEEKKQLAAERSLEAQRELEVLGGVLQHTLEINDAIDWEKLTSKEPFRESRPAKPKAPPAPQPLPSPRKPLPTDAAYEPRLGLLDRLLSSRRERIVADSQAKYARDLKAWEQEAATVESTNRAQQLRYEKDLRDAETAYQSSLRDWEGKKQAFEAAQQASNDAIYRRRAAYLSGAPDAILEYADIVLSASQYPDYFPKEFSLDYVPETKLFIVDYALPAPGDLPTLREVKFIQSRGEFSESHLSSAQIEKIYDPLLYQIALRTLHELFESDVIGAIGTICFNGFVTSIDPRTGQQVTACVLSIQVQRGEFTSINLASIDPKACFKALKGVGSSKLHSLTPVPPLLQLRRDDSRFVQAYDVAQTMDTSTNLAAMDWEDFEHLIRELFEKEFQSTGGEVKVTQASRDGGVDAIAFNPDPIQGGKTVIQAKRYAHTVGVAAVRDLYGTVMNEGANKGILVTTADFGPDAYEFVKGKPLVLISGSNLLHLLEKHGHKARIDLHEARRLLKQNASLAQL